MIVSAAGAFVTGSVAYFTAVRLLSSLFGFVTVTYTVPPVDSNKSFTSIVASFPPSATASDVAFASPSFATLYTFTMSPSVKSVTLIVSFAPVLLFSTVIVLLLALLILPYHTSLLFVSFLSHLHLLRSHTLFHLLLLKIRLFNLYFCFILCYCFVANVFPLSLRHIPLRYRLQLNLLL